MKRGVGDHADERCAPHEVAEALAIIKRMQAQETARRLMRSVGVEPRINAS